MSETRQAICPQCETANPVENRFRSTRGANMGTAQVLQATNPAEAPKKRRRPLSTTAAAVAACIVLSMIAAILGGCGSGEEAVPPTVAEVQITEAEQAEATEAPAPTEPPPTEGPRLPKLGDVLEQDGYSLSAVTVESPAKIDTTALEPVPNTIMVAVEFVVGNVSAEPFTVNPLHASLVSPDPEGDFRWKAYESEMGAMREHELIATTEIGPGEEVRGWMAWVLPAGEDPAQMQLQYEFNPPNGPKLMVGLGE